MLSNGFLKRISDFIKDRQLLSKDGKYIVALSEVPTALLWLWLFANWATRLRLLIAIFICVVKNQTVMKISVSSFAGRMA